MICKPLNLLQARIGLFGLLFFCCSTIAAQRPNIIYIMTDDMGYADLSGYGRKDYQTPHLDKLASEGMKFMQAYSAGPLCTPTRTGFMTGRYPARTAVGLKEPLTPRDSAFGLNAGRNSVAALVKASGYETALVGKWHLGVLPQYSPMQNGFEYFYGIHSGAADYISHKGEGRRSDLYENENEVEKEGYLTNMFTEKAIAFIQQKHNKPFFLTLNYNAPHWPWQGPTNLAYADTLDFKAGGTPAIYAAMMKSLDDGVGAVMKALDDAGLRNQTIVIFTNDNGGEKFSDHGGLAQQKGTLWEGGIKVPAFVRWPGKIKPGTITQQAAITMDWTATILAVAGAKADRAIPLDGVDLMPVLQGRNNAVDRTFYWRTFQRTQQKAIREGRWKYLQDKAGEYLFDLVADPGEKNNLKEENPEMFLKLKTKYALWERQMLKPIPL